MGWLSAAVSELLCDDVLAIHLFVDIFVPGLVVVCNFGSNSVPNVLVISLLAAR